MGTYQEFERLYGVSKSFQNQKGTLVQEGTSEGIASEKVFYQENFI